MAFSLGLSARIRSTTDVMTSKHENRFSRIPATTSTALTCHNGLSILQNWTIHPPRNTRQFFSQESDSEQIRRSQNQNGETGDSFSRAQTESQADACDSPRFAFTDAKDVPDTHRQRCYGNERNRSVTSKF